jgi:hypothetical protein
MDYTPSPAPDKPPALVSYAPADEWKPVSVPPVSVSTPAPDPFPPGGYWRPDPVYGSVYVHPTPGAPAVAPARPFTGPATSTPITPATPVAGPLPGYPAAVPRPVATPIRAFAATYGNIRSGCST